MTHLEPPQEAATVHYTPTAGHLALIHPDLSDVPVAGGVDRTQNPEEGPDLRRHAIDDRGRFCRDKVFFCHDEEDESALRAAQVVILSAYRSRDTISVEIPRSQDTQLGDSNCLYDPWIMINPLDCDKSLLDRNP
jgi:hypothetical protein